MGILKTRHVLLVALVSACYAPEARDCTVACASADTCLSGQVCGSDGFCAAPDVAGSCAGDAGVTLVSLQVHIEGHGKVAVDALGNCDSETAPKGNCTFTVAANAAHQLDAITSGSREFIGWTQTCTGNATTCSITPVMAVTLVGAKFE